MVIFCLVSDRQRFSSWSHRSLYVTSVEVLTGHHFLCLCRHLASLYSGIRSRLVSFAKECFWAFVECSWFVWVSEWVALRLREAASPYVDSIEGTSCLTLPLAHHLPGHCRLAYRLSSLPLANNSLDAFPFGQMALFNCKSLCKRFNWTKFPPHYFSYSQKITFIELHFHHSQHAALFRRDIIFRLFSSISQSDFWCLWVLCPNYSAQFACSQQSPARAFLAPNRVVPRAALKYLQSVPKLLAPILALYA